MKNVLCLASGLLIIVLTYYLHSISSSLAYSAGTAPPSAVFAVIQYLAGAALVLMGLISKET
ncbi:hypothetical protein [Paenibacillus senegalensis]|uniref:hypothetical protein n=1 Tax=Paenibacillus senegalensis TaxID=1465766 RepID=UPI000289AFB1|nr:hypothetical protein [Paenibacillus senegalensis]